MSGIICKPNSSILYRLLMQPKKTGGFLIACFFILAPLMVYHQAMLELDNLKLDNFVL